MLASGPMEVNTGPPSEIDIIIEVDFMKTHEV